MMDSGPSIVDARGGEPDALVRVVAGALALAVGFVAAVLLLG